MLGCRIRQPIILKVKKMRFIFCLDDKNGMMFNSRRQSQDRILRERILDMTKGARLFMSEYSAKQFEANDNIIVSNNYLKEATENDFCFIEDGEFSIDSASEIIIYRWNRHYPSDRKFDIDLNTKDFKLYHSEDFVGSSHEKITEEKYKKGL